MCRWRLLFWKTRRRSLPKAADACLIRFWISLSMLQSSERILPRYLNDGVIVSGLWSMVKAGRVCGVLELHWQTTSVLVAGQEFHGGHGRRCPSLWPCAPRKMTCPNGQTGRGAARCPDRCPLQFILPFFLCAIFRFLKAVGCILHKMCLMP